MKPINSNYKLIKEIETRFSTRAFSEKEISEHEIFNITEAARWAPSSGNEQPWLYYYSLKNHSSFSDVLNCIAEGNKPWAKNAAAFIISCTKINFQASGKENSWAYHDLGLANAQLILQAQSLGIYTHPMGGFDKQKISILLSLEETVHPVCVIAIGFLGNAESLQEPFKSRELSERKRKSLNEILFKI